jgi:tRNA G18 (ribose-2'-O)-methylase SpoU
LDDYRNVPDAELLKRRGIFVAEGRLVVARLLAESRRTVRSVMVTRAARAALADVLTARPGLPVYIVPQDVMDGITGFNMHRGCLAIGNRPSSVRWQDIAAAALTIVVLERVSNADNVGGIFRSAAAFGAGAVLLDPVSTDPLYRKAIRTSVGAALTMPFARADPWPDSLRELREQGVALMGMTPSAAARPLKECAEAVGGRRTAIVVGHEGDGLSVPVLGLCDYHARIPMASGVDSLNVATAAAVALYELTCTT